MFFTGCWLFIHPAAKKQNYISCSLPHFSFIMIPKEHSFLASTLCNELVACFFGLLVGAKTGTVEKIHSNNTILIFFFFQLEQNLEVVV